jgi:phosphatidylserine decarboxylase
MNISNFFFVLPQYLVPQHLLSKWMSKLTHCENIFWKNLFIRFVIDLYGVNLIEAKKEHIEDYRNFNEFFTRELKPGVRNFSDNERQIASPADGAISQIGRISAGKIIQAKGRDYSVLELLGGERDLANLFTHGNFATLYLSPKDYHRLHMPLSGRLIAMLHIPGRLFSVNKLTASSVPKLFARNERVVCIFDTAAGPMALVLIGAIFVSGIETIWHGAITPPSIAAIKRWQYDDQITLQKGAEMGRFNMGSTVIVLFAENKITWNAEIQAEQVIKLGELLGNSLAE